MTVRTVDPTIAPDVALIVLVPTAAAVASPVTETGAPVDDHVTDPVRFCVVLSVKVPVAVNCCVRPLAIDGFAGVTAIDTSVAWVTVRTVDPTIAPDVALMVLVPTAAAVASPVTETGAPVDDHVTDPVRFCVLLSVKVPVAVNCCVRPLAIDGFAGVTAIDTNVAAVTVRTVDPTIAPDVALIVLVPTAAAVASPVTETGAPVDAHVTDVVRFCVVLSV